MTAIKDVTLDNGIEVKDAIHRVEHVVIGYKNKVTYKVRVYKDISLPFFFEFDGEFTYTGGDAIEESYQHLNQNSEYTKA